ncbi:MAG: DNA ligase D, partial [Actinomycetota bacterium]|nr:DNA ligase D [Actinomycetota bacterium]
PEPFGGRKRGKEPIFVVQRHDARRLHYDFRLERDGALASWAVPKGVPLEPGQRQLAVHVEDHPLEYASFEGEIPKGQYGAGTVEIWDRGTYELVEEKKDGGLTVRLHGDRLEGTWTLVPAKLDGDPKNWLLIKKREDGAQPVARTEYAPMLATLADDVPRGKGWLFEVKWDGYRAVAYVRGGEATLVSRNGNDLTGRFPGVGKAIERAVRSPECVLDGEVGALDENGRMTFSAMQQGKSGTSYVYVAFDVLEIDGRPLVDRPLTERREALGGLLDGRNRAVQLSEAFDDGEALFRAAEEQGFEGIIAKRTDSRYLAGRRTRDWLKVKTHGEQEFVVAGYTRGKGRRSAGFGSLVLAVHDEDAGGLRYVGNVGTGFTDAEIDRLLDLLRPLERDTSPFRAVPKMPKVRRGDVVWLEPELVAQVEFAEWTHDGHLRAPRYKGLREDKPAEEVEREDPVPEPEPKSASGSKPQTVEGPVPKEIRKGDRVLKLSNLDKVFFPDDGITKGDLLSYYRAIAPVLVPHLKGRPFTMKRYPDGIAGGFFFQKDAPKHMPDWIPTRKFWASTRDRPPKRRLIDFALVEDELALLWMVNMGCIDMNTWYSRVDKPERPDFVLFDLDPSPDVGFAETIEVALILKQALDALGLQSFPKTSGSEGIHVLVPIARRHTYDDTRQFSEIVAGAIARAHRGLATTEWSKRKRRGVLIDANQNGEGKTIASVYSVRPKPGAPVSTPLRWDEVNEKLNPSIYSMDVVLDRVRRGGDVFEPVLTTRQSLTAALDSLR